MNQPFRLLRVLVLALAASATLLAQDVAPLPDKLVAAKSAYLINESGDIKAFDRLFKDLKVWNRFNVVTDRDQADIIIVLMAKERGGVAVASGTAVTSGNVASGSGTSVNVPSVFLQIRISDRTNQEVLWTDEAEKWITSGHAPAKLISNLRKRFPKPAAPGK